MKKTDAAVFYPLSPSQEVIMYQQAFCLSKNVVQVPFYYLTKRKVDVELMKRAISEEIKRNDCMRIRFFKKGGKQYQYFLDSLEIDVPYFEFRSQAEQDAVLQKDASEVVHHLKGETYRIKLFSRWDGTFGIYINVHHAVMDAVGLHIFLDDLCKVYDALESGSEMPAPLNKFEESLKRDLEAANDTAKRERDKEFWRKLFKEYKTPPAYAGIEGPHRLDKARKRKPNTYTVNILNPFNEKSGLEVLTIPADLMTEVRRLSAQRGCAIQDFLQTAMRIYLSATNHDQGDVTFLELCSRRAKMADRNTCGCRCHAVYTRTLFNDDSTYLEVTEALTRRHLLVYRHSDLGTLDMFDIEQKTNHNPVTGACFATAFTYIARPADPNDKWCLVGAGYNPGKFALPMYMFCSDNPTDGSVDCRYIYREFIFSKQNMIDFHNGMVNILRAAVEDPDKTVGEIKKYI